MSSDLATILRLEVPVIVQIGQRRLTMAEVLNLAPGALIELPRSADSELDILANNKQIGTGHVVKVGENFGIRISYMGELSERVIALGPDGSEDLSPALPEQPATTDAEVAADG